MEEEKKVEEKLPKPEPVPYALQGSGRPDTPILGSAISISTIEPVYSFIPPKETPPKESPKDDS